jgi:hypothetical protein
MRIIGIDPGLSGAFFYIDDEMNFAVEKLPVKDGKIDVLALTRDLQYLNPTHVFIEKIFLTGREGGQSAMTIGSNYGRLMALLELKDITLIEVQPRFWQRALGLKGGSRAIVKQQAKDLAVSRFGLTPFMFGKSRKPHDGCTDAACIALYGVLYLMEGNPCAPKKKLTKSTQTSARSTGTRAKRSTSSKDKPVSSKPNSKSRSKKPKLPVKAK